MARTLLILCLAAASLAAKDRAWQTGQLLDKNLNPYFRTMPAANNGGGAASSSSAATFVTGDNGAMAISPHPSDGAVSYDNYVIAAADMVYLVEFAHFKGFPSANLSLSKPIAFAVEKGKLWIMDQDRTEFETTILKQVEAHGTRLASAGAPASLADQEQNSKLEQAKAAQAKADQARAEAKAAQARADQAKAEEIKAEQARAAQFRAEQEKAEQAKADQARAEQARAAQARAEQAKAEQARAAQAKAEQARAAQAKAEQARAEQAKAEQARAAQAKAEQARAEQARAEQARADQVKPKSSKPDNVFATAALTNDAPAKPASVAKPTPAAASAKEPALEASVTKPAVRPQAEPKGEAPVTRPAARPEPRPEGPVVRASTKDRAWQAGQLLSVPNNNYFFNVTYTTDLEGSAWAFAQGSDGRYTVTGQIAGVTNSPYTYDNYVLESPFVAYLVQRMRPKTSPPVRLPGTQPLKFAVDKGKMWVLDEQGIEYETKVVKLIQKDAIVDPLTRAAAR